MTNQQTLEKAIQKAIDGGWKPTKVSTTNAHTHHFDVSEHPASVWFWVKFENDLRKQGEDYSYCDIIFNHDFAKALWDKPFPCTNIPATFEINLEDIPAWQYHLQQMVIAEDPIKYLGENI